MYKQGCTSEKSQGFQTCRFFLEVLGFAGRGGTGGANVALGANAGRYRGNEHCRSFAEVRRAVEDCLAFYGVKGVKWERGRCNCAQVVLVQVGVRGNEGSSVADAWLAFVLGPGSEILLCCCSIPVLSGFSKSATDPGDSLGPQE